MPSSLSGAHELPKVAKEHATEFHQNPNYEITFELNWLLWCVNNEIVVSLYWKLVGYNSLWIWIVMAPGNLRKFRAPYRLWWLMSSCLYIYHLITKCSVFFPLNGRSTLSHLFSNLEIIQLIIIIDLFPCCALYRRSLRDWYMTKLYHSCCRNLLCISLDSYHIDPLYNNFCP